MDAKAKAEQLKSRAEEADVWKNKYKTLQQQQQHPGSSSMDTAVEGLTQQLEEEQEENSKLRDRLKKYAERIGAMEVT